MRSETLNPFHPRNPWLLRFQFSLPENVKPAAVRQFCRTAAIYQRVSL
jgi:hypothetical protein